MVETTPLKAGVSPHVYRANQIWRWWSGAAELNGETPELQKVGVGEVARVRRPRTRKHAVDVVGGGDLGRDLIRRVDRCKTALEKVRKLAPAVRLVLGHPRVP